MINKSYEFDIVDFHAHILPGADHGSSCTKTSFDQLNFAKSAGITRIIGTPHFYPHLHSLDDFLRKRNESYKRLSRILNNELPEIRLGAEVLLCDRLDMLIGIEKLCIYGSNVIMLELPYSDITKEHYNAVKYFLKRGFDVVMAHAERYSFGDVETMIELGAKIQINSSALSSFFLARSIKDWLKRGKVIAIGSDIHHADKTAYKHFQACKRKILEYLPYIKEQSNIIWEKTKPFVIE